MADVNERHISRLNFKVKLCWHKNLQEKEFIISVRHEWTNLPLGSLFGITRQSLLMPNSDPWNRFVHPYFTLMSYSYIIAEIIIISCIIKTVKKKYFRDESNKVTRKSSKVSNCLDLSESSLSVEAILLVMSYDVYLPGKLYLFWLFIVTLAFMYNAYSIPLRAVFPYQTSENLKYWLLCDYICDLIYVLDILIFKVRISFLNSGLKEVCSISPYCMFVC